MEGTFIIRTMTRASRILFGKCRTGCAMSDGAKKYLGTSGAPRANF